MFQSLRCVLGTRTRVTLLACALVAAGLASAAPAAATGGTVAAPTVQQVSTDTLPPYTTNGATMQHATEMETDTFSWGSTVVSAFQVGRNGAGYGAQAIGWATSADNGQTWTNGILPGLTATSPDPNSTYPVVVNQSVAYDALHGQWLIPSVTYLATTLNHFHETALLVNRSTDGTTWGDAITAVSTNVDKAWGVCDNTATSPHYGTCYVAYSRIDSSDALAVVSTTDGGATWSAPVLVPSATAGVPSTGYNTNPVVQPNGTVVLVSTDVANGNNGSKLLSTVSTDGGATWSIPVTLATIQYATPASAMRAKDKPSVDVDAAGTVYAAWSDCRFHTSCGSDDIVYATSTDGVAWSAPNRVAVDVVSTVGNKFIPGFGVEPGTSGSSAHLSAVFYTFQPNSCPSACALLAKYTTSYNGGATWSPAYVINPTAFPITWLGAAFTGGPRMVGDYLSISYCNGSPITVVSLATAAPDPGPVYHESENALTLPVDWGKPGAPTIGTATAGNASASVAFTPPASNGGSPITGYTVTASPGGLTGSGAASPIPVSGLTNGTSYTFTVKATNAVGTGPASAASNAVTPATLPGAPTIGTATAGNTSASVAFTPPASDGGSPITGYTVTASPGGMTGNGVTSPIPVSGLTNGTSYTFTVTATNAVGTGPASAASNAVTPLALPGAPTIGTATAGNTTASVTFTPPASNGGSPITGYTVTASPGGLTGSGAASPITVSGLSNGTSYTFTVTATNGVGPGPASAASNAVTPKAPSALTISPGGTITITAGSSTTVTTKLTNSSNGAAISGVSVSLQSRPGTSGTFTTIRNISTNNSGIASASVQPTANTQYRWTWTGGSAMKYLGATSPIETVQVAQGVSAHATAVKVTRNHTVKLYGKVLPKGSGTYVTLQQYVHGAWHYVKKVKIKYQHMPTGGSYTGFLIAYTSRTAGTKSLRVLHAATSKNLAGHSTTRKIRFV